jgi:uroporphyrinogen decarboxylase
MVKKMTPRERILAALRHQVPDRTPTDGWFHDEVERRLLRHYGTEDWQEVLCALGIEGWASLRPRMVVPAYEARAEERTYRDMTRRGVWRDERTYANEMGVVHRIGESGWYEEWISGPLMDADGTDLAVLDDAPLPVAAHIVEPEDYAAQVQALKERELFVSAGISNPYKTAWEMRGMENVLADYLVNRDFLEALYDRLYAFYTDFALRAVRAGVDMIAVTGDIAMQDRIIMGPKAWREVDKPRLAHFIAACRRVNPKLFMYIHSDGNVMEVMDDLVEIGFDVINPIQPECMDPVEVKRRWGDRITLHGGVSLQRTLPNGTVAEVRREIEHLIRTCGYNGGLVVFPSNVIQPDTPTENIIACYHAARDFDVAACGGHP